MAASYTTNFVAFILCYGVVGAAGCGILYMVPLVIGWQHFPKRKGLVTGMILSADGMGTFFYTLIAQNIVNPDNELPDVDSGQENLKFFDKEISMRVPSMFRYLCIIYAVQCLIAFAFMTRPVKSDEEDEAEYEKVQTTVEE